MSNTPENKISDKLSEIKMKRDGMFQLSGEVSGKLEPDINVFSKKENTRIADKKIANNKPSQFRPILGVNFHMLKK